MYNPHTALLLHYITDRQHFNFKTLLEIHFDGAATSDYDENQLTNGAKHLQELNKTPAVCILSIGG